MDGAASRPRQPKALEKMVGGIAAGFEADEMLRLIQIAPECRPEREANDYAVRNVTRQVAEPQQGDADLNRADKERDYHRRLDALAFGNNGQCARGAQWKWHWSGH